MVEPEMVKALNDVGLAWMLAIFVPCTAMFLYDLVAWIRTRG